MDRPLTVAVAGCGSRGQLTYSKLLMGMPDKAVIVAAADIDPTKLDGMRRLAGLPESALYPSAEDMLRADKLADVMLICTPDRCHYAHAKAALLKDYDLLLEKPISPTAAECEELRDIAYSIVGEPEPVQFEDRIVGIIEARDGTIMDVVRQVKHYD